MRKIIIGAAAFGLALVSGAAVAQNQGGGPGAANFGTNSNPPNPETGGTSNTQTARPTNPNAAEGRLYNQAQPQQRRGTTGYKH
jgi:hypothetical protein